MIRSSFRLTVYGLIVGGLTAGLGSCGGDSGDNTGMGGRGGLGGAAGSGKGTGGGGAGGARSSGGGGGSGSGGAGGSNLGGGGGSIPGSGGAGGGEHGSGGSGAAGSGAAGVAGAGTGGATGGFGGLAAGGQGAGGTGGLGSGAAGAGGGGRGAGGAGAGGAAGSAAGGAAGNPGMGGAAGGSGAGGSTVVSCSGTSMVPGRPVLWGPRRGAYTGSFRAVPALMTLRPTFVWHAPAGCAADTYEIQVDNSCLPGQIATCAFPTPEVAATVSSSTTRYTPPTALGVQMSAPVGAIYAWRVRACAGAAGCGAWSEVGYLNVGRVTNDINGDGYADLVADSVERNTFTNRLEIYAGSTSGTSAPVHVGGPALGGVDYTAPLFVGDVNGDGFGDFLARHTNTQDSSTTPVLFFGGPNLTALSSVSLTSNADQGNHYTGFSNAGDLNGDGFSDLAVNSGTRVSTEATAFDIYFGATAFADKAPDLVTQGPYTSPPPAPSVMQSDESRSIGDVNGDGFPYVAIVHTAQNHTGLIRIFLGGSALDVVPDGDISLTDFSVPSDPPGDLNGDGYDDIVVNQGGYGILRGGPTLPSVYSPTDATALAVLAGFDFNADGSPDLLLNSGNALILGGPTPTTTSGLTWRMAIRPPISCSCCSTMGR